MDVKGVNIAHVVLPKEGKGSAKKANGDSPLQSIKITSSAGLSVSLPQLPGEDTQEVNNKQAPLQFKKNDLRSRANELISVTNIATETTDEIEKLVKSIDGIVEQVKDGKLSDQRKSKLEAEANSLISEIKKKASTATPLGVKPLAGDKVTFSPDDDENHAIEFSLPKGAEDAFGLPKVDFSSHSSIIHIVTKVEEARKRVQELRDAVKGKASNIQSTIDELDVASQNNEAAQVSLRDVDEALRLASQTKTGIVGNPKSALGSVGSINPQVLGLLD